MQNLAEKFRQFKILPTHQQTQIISVISLLALVITLPILLFSLNNTSQQQTVNSQAATSSTDNTAGDVENETLITNAAKYCPQPADVVFVLDDSNSMQVNANKVPKIRYAMHATETLIKSASKNNFIKALGVVLISNYRDTHDYIGLEDPHGNASAMVNDLEKLHKDTFTPVTDAFPQSSSWHWNKYKETYKNTYATHEGTDIVRGEHFADDILTYYQTSSTGHKKGDLRNNGIKHVVILLSDGKANMTSNGEFSGKPPKGKTSNDIINQAKQDALDEVNNHAAKSPEKIQYYVIGYGDASQDFLKKISKNSYLGVEHYYHTNNVSDLLSIYATIIKDTCKPTTNGVKVSLVLNLKGVYTGSQSGLGYKINNNPLTPTRAIELQFLNPNNETVIKSIQSTVKFDSNQPGSKDANAGNFVSDTITLPNDFSAGTYKILVKTNRYLRKSLGVFALKADQVNNLTPSGPSHLIVGDTNGDNAINITDFANIAACFPNTSYNTAWCSDSLNKTDKNLVTPESDKTLSDLNDLHNPQGNNWNDQMNLLLEDFAQPGD